MVCAGVGTVEGGTRGGEDGDEDESVSSVVRGWTGDEDEGRQSRLGMYKQKKARVD